MKESKIKHQHLCDYELRERAVLLLYLQVLLK